MSDTPNPDDETVPAEAQRLRALLGEWSVTGSLTVDNSAAAVTGTWRFVSAADGWGVQGTMGADSTRKGSIELPADVEQELATRRSARSMPRPVAASRSPAAPATN